MGSSGNWLKLFIPHRKSNPNDQENVLGGKRSKKWKLWRSSSSCSSSDQSRLSVKRGQVAASESSDLPAVADIYTAAMATLVRAPPKDFLIIRQEWAAIRIQTAFRALLARRAFRALKALVRLQAIVRGRLVRKQAAMTLKCMQALVRAQAQVKAHRVRMSLEGESLHKKLEIQSDPPVKQEEGKWCDSRGSKEEVKTKLQMRQEAAIKKERAMAYFISQQQLRASPNLNPTKKESFSGPIKLNNKPEKCSSWSWLDGLTGSKSSSESRLTEEPNSKKKANATITTSSNSSEYDSIRVTTRNNNMTRRVTARAPTQGDASYCSSSSQPSSSTTAFEGTEDSASSASVGLNKPRYMNLTASNRAKHREGISKSRFREIPHLAQHYAKSGLRFSGEMKRNSVDSALCSVSIHSEDVNPPNLRLDRYDKTRCRLKCSVKLWFFQSIWCFWRVPTACCVKD